MRRAIALAVLVLLVLSSCGGDDDPVSTGSSSSASSSSSSSSTSSTAPGEDLPATTTTAKRGGGTATSTAPAVIRVVVCCGFVPFGWDFAAVPTVVQADGTAFTAGAMTLQYPGPPIHPVSTGRLSAKQVQSLLDAAPAAGLTSKPDVGTNLSVADAATTKITVVIDGKAHETSVYALDFEDPGLTAEQKAARAKVSEWVEQVGEAVSAAATSTFEPTAYQVLATPSQPASAYEDPKPNQIDWPVPSKPLSDGPPCTDLTGADATALRSKLASASQITIWRSGGKDWQVVTRATLPGDAPCA